MTPHVFVETERIILRELHQDDAEAMYLMDSDPLVHRYLGNEPVTSIEQIHGAIQSIRGQYIENGIGRWAVIEKNSGEFIGWSGLKLMKVTVNEHVNYYDVGYRFLHKYWGMGYATETAIASVRYGFDVLKAPMLYAMTEQGNTGSENVLLKTGFTMHDLFEYDNAQNHWYSIRSEDWKLKR